MRIRGRRISGGNGRGKALVTSSPISFLGGVDPETGRITEGELEGESIKGRVLIFPGGKGSTVGSYVIYQLKKNEKAPSAMINLLSEPIVAVGAIISGIPLIDKPEKHPFLLIEDGDDVFVNGTEGYFEI